MDAASERYAPGKSAFGAWLLTQEKRDGWVGDLARGAKLDRAFPRAGDVDAVRTWLSGQRASRDDWEALEDAEGDWLAI